MRLSTVRYSILDGLSPTPSIAILPLPASAAAASRNMADDGSPGMSISNGVNRAGRTQTGASPRRLHFEAEMTQHALGVVAARRRLVQRDRDSAGGAGQQEGTLDLRRRHRQSPLQGVQVTSADGERQAVAGWCGNARSHRDERLRDAPHRTTPKRLVSRQSRRESVGSQHAKQQSSGRPRVAAIKPSHRLGQASMAAHGDRTTPIGAA